LGHGVNLGEVIDKITATECKRLAKAGDNFNVLKKRKVSKTASLEGTDLASWVDKDSQALFESIYDKIYELKLRYPHVSKNAKYRRNVRVYNIRKRIWLLLMHVRSWQGALLIASRSRMNETTLAVVN
jgi:hypothetical protein